MTDSYLRNLGFASTDETQGSHPPFEQNWRYQHENQALDGARLYAEHPLGIAACRLSALAAPLAAADVWASVALDDRPALEAAVASFYAAHGGKGAVVPPLVPHLFRPFRRLE
ncbi:hypothetical protein [Hymenobacter aerophilus]|uniref:hypothetical protein n=1 Tax=Hymenobacter aerophilus TaxID=119644 RepID=UPI00037385FE|nr:hypothetical protein [Hymenobacter aerophilus]